MIFSAALVEDRMKALCECNMMTNADILTLFIITSAEGTAMTCKVTSGRCETSCAIPVWISPDTGIKSLS